MSSHNSTPFATAARTLHAAGWSPLPLPPRSKANPPTGYTGEHGARPDAATIDQWLETHAAGNVAVRAPDGIVGVDVDQYGDKTGNDRLEQLLAELDITLPATWISSARPFPSGIRWLRIPAGVRLRGAPLPGVEIVQRHHRYAVAPPSIHPDTGDAYRWIAPGGELSTTPPPIDELPDMPAELIAAWADTTEPAAHRPARPAAPAPAGRDRSRAVDDVLSSRRGWAPGGRHDEACRVSMALARLEHSGHPGATEALEHVGADFAAAVGGERDGDREWRSLVDSARRTAATTEASRPDYGELVHDRPAPRPPSNGDDLSGLDLDADLEAGLEVGWQPFEPLVRAQVAAFPLDVLPDWIRSEVEACADELAVPVDMPAVAAIGALSVVAAGRVDVQPGPRYKTPTNLYVCIVAESGAGKSPVMARIVTGPARALETKLAELNRKGVAAARAHTQRLEAARDEAAKKLKNNPSDSGERDLARAEAELDDDEPLMPPVVVLSDVTPERLTAVIAEQQGRAAIVTPEGGTLFESIAGLRYRAGGVDASAKVPDVYLSGYSREALRTDRVGRSSVLVENPTLAVVTSVQPVVVERLAATPDVARQGALARFLWAWPAGRIGWRPQDSYRHAPDDDGIYRARMLELGLRARSWTTPLVIDVDDAARDLRDAWAEQLEARIRPGGDLHPHRAGVSKLQTTPWRLAGLLAFADGAGAHSRVIDAELMARALELCDYFLANAVAAEQVAGVAAGADSALHVLAAKLTLHAGEVLTIRDVQLAMRGTVSSVTDLAAPILELEGMGWLRVDGDMSAIGRRGVANPTLFVHPELSPAALHPTIEPAEATREPRELIHRHGEVEADATREPRELVDPRNEFARMSGSREGAFRSSSSSSDSSAAFSQGTPRANNSTARTEPLFDPTATAPLHELKLGADPFGPANTDTTAGELW